MVSDSLAEADLSWKPTRIIRRADVARAVEELRAQPGGYLYLYGSAALVRALLAADLVDELLLTIEPILLGGGKTIFPANGEAMPFTLLSTAQARTGALVCHYARARSSPP